MPILIFLILVLMVAQWGFWDTLGAIIGGAAMLVVLGVLGFLLLALVAAFLLRRVRR